MFRKSNMVYYPLFDVKIKGEYIEAKMKESIFKSVTKKEKDLLVVIEDGQKIFYLATPLLPYRILIIEDK